MKGLRIRKRRDKRLDSPNPDAREAAINEGAIATSPERLMVAITNAMGEVVQSPEEFEELLVLLMHKAKPWVRHNYLMRSHNAEVERREGKAPLIL